ncbi:MAG: hypothetical protein ACRDOB_12535 [Streptosporangiaceae bacterium]
MAAARSAAGLIMAGCFGALTLIPTGVLLNTLLVPTVLVPASLLTIGERVWSPASAPV